MEPKTSEENKIYVFTAAHVIINPRKCRSWVLASWKCSKIIGWKEYDCVIKTYQQTSGFGDVGIIVLDYTYNNFRV